MRILADENVPRPVVTALREAGNDVVWTKETSPGARDRAVLASAQVENRLVLTYDKDFGELAVRYAVPAASGVVLVRLSGPSPEIDNARVVEALIGRDDWAGYFAVITDDRVRLRPLPKPG
jgi:predicted nuclease of predicted toxin-antitoxin system